MIKIQKICSKAPKQKLDLKDNHVLKPFLNILLVNISYKITVPSLNETSRLTFDNNVFQ